MRVLLDNYGGTRIFYDRPYGYRRYHVEWDDGNTSMFSGIWYSEDQVREIVEKGRQSLIKRTKQLYDYRTDTCFTHCTINYLGIIMMDFLLLPYTLLVWGLKYIIAIGLWYLLFQMIYNKASEIDWEDWWYSSKNSIPTLMFWKRKKNKNPYKRGKDYGEDPEDYIV